MKYFELKSFDWTVCLPVRQEVSATEGSSTPASPDLQRADAGAGQESPLLPQLRHGDINEPQDGLSYGEGCQVLRVLDDHHQPLLHQPDVAVPRGLHDHQVLPAPA